MKSINFVKQDLTNLDIGDEKILSGWGWKLLSEIVEIHDTARIPIKASERTPGSIPYCGANGVIDHIDGYTHEGEFVMLAEDGGFFGPGEHSTYMMTGRFWANNHVHVLRGANGKLHSHYLHYYLTHTDLRPYLTGATRPKLTQTAMKNIPIPIPYPDDSNRSLAEQRRIVARLETLLAEVSEARKINDEIKVDTDRLMDAVIQDVFDHPNRNWKIKELSDVALVQTGTAKGRRFGGRKTIELPYLRVANVQTGYLKLDEIKTIRIAEDEIERYKLETGDLLLTEGGDFDKLGRGAVWRSEIELCIHQNHVFAVRFNQSEVLPEFAEYEMQS
jgi:type I restriction enzyme S subunit